MENDSYKKQSGRSLTFEEANKEKTDMDYLNRRYWGDKYSTLIIVATVLIYYVAIYFYSYGYKWAWMVLCVLISALLVGGYIRHRRFSKPLKKETPDEWANRVINYIESKNKR